MNKQSQNDFHIGLVPILPLNICKTLGQPGIITGHTHLI